MPTSAKISFDRDRHMYEEDSDRDSTLSSQDSLTNSPGMERVEEFMAAFKHAVDQFRRGEEEGPYAFPGEFSQAEFEKLDAQCELKWRIGYDKTARQILLYGDATYPHHATIASLRTNVQKEISLFFDQLGPTADTQFNLFSPSDKVVAVLDVCGGQSWDLHTVIKQADEVYQLAGVDHSRIALAVEVAFANESGGKAAEETVQWIRSGRAEFALAVKIKRNPANEIDPFITVFFSDCREIQHYMRETNTGAVPATTKAVIHEWPCGSGSAIAPQPSLKMRQSTLGTLKLETAASPLSSNPAPVHYDATLDAEVVFHGGVGPTDNLRLALGRSWAEEYRVPTNRLVFSAQDWDKVRQRLCIEIHLGKLRGDIISYMMRWRQEGCPS